MREDIKNEVTALLQNELDRQRATARQEFDRRAGVAREEFDRRADTAKYELGDRLFDLTEEYFPEVARQRRRRYAAVAFAGGVVAGFVARHVLGR